MNLEATKGTKRCRSFCAAFDYQHFRIKNEKQTEAPGFAVHCREQGDRFVPFVASWFNLLL